MYIFGCKEVIAYDQEVGESGPQEGAAEKVKLFLAYAVVPSLSDSLCEAWSLDDVVFDWLC